MQKMPPLNRKSDHPTSVFIHFTDQMLQTDFSKSNFTFWPHFNLVALPLVKQAHVGFMQAWKLKSPSLVLCLISTSASVFFFCFFLCWCMNDTHTHINHWLSARKALMEIVGLRTTWEVVPEKNRSEKNGSRKNIINISSEMNTRGQNRMYFLVSMAELLSRKFP